MKIIVTLYICVFCHLVKAQSADSMSIALNLIGLSFTEAQLDSMRAAVADETAAFEEIRKESLPNDLQYSLVFSPPLNTNRIPKVPA